MKANKKILIIDYRVGNHQSIANALSFLGYKFLVSNKAKDIAEADAFILPGVGAFAEAMKNLHQLGIIDPLAKQVLTRKKPLLGICLGMQVLADYSEENGYHKGLGWIKGGFVRFKEKKGLRVPHVGWNDIKIIKKEPLFNNLKGNANFYFDHSYYFVGKERYASAKCDYGGEFIAALQKDNIMAVQFHPEKSQNHGLRLFRAFCNYLEKR